MRFSGQGMMSHTATTTISRYFTKSRGKALSTGWFGLSTAEFILPVLMIYLLAITNWKNIWISASIIIIILLPLVTYFLVKNLNFDSRENSDDHEFNEDKIKQFWKHFESCNKITTILDKKILFLRLNSFLSILCCRNRKKKFVAVDV